MYQSLAWGKVEITDHWLSINHKYFGSILDSWKLVSEYERERERREGRKWNLYLVYTFPTNQSFLFNHVTKQQTNQISACGPVIKYGVLIGQNVKQKNSFQHPIRIVGLVTWSSLTPALVNLLRWNFRLYIQIGSNNTVEKISFSYDEKCIIIFFFFVSRKK